MSIASPFLSPGVEMERAYWEILSSKCLISIHISSEQFLEQ
jgi:hypothetical protein